MLVSDQLIHTEILVNATKAKFLATFVYVHNDTKNREHLWSMLCNISARISLPWCVGGDFNAIMNYDDRVGSAVRDKEIIPMSHCMQVCELHTVKSVGRYYTWNNKQDGCHRVMSKIDRCLSNKA